MEEYFNQLDYRQIRAGRERRIAYEQWRRSGISVRRYPNGETSSVQRDVLGNVFLEGLPLFDSDNFTYEVLSELKNISVGLINKNIVKNTDVQINYIKDNFCVICQENITVDNTNLIIIRVLYCTHCFHIKCIDTWLIDNNKCPTCKTEI